MNTPFNNKNPDNTYITFRFMLLFFDNTYCTQQFTKVFFPKNIDKITSSVTFLPAKSKVCTKDGSFFDMVTALGLSLLLNLPSMGCDYSLSSRFQCSCIVKYMYNVHIKCVKLSFFTVFLKSKTHTLQFLILLI